MPVMLNGKYELGRTLGEGVSCKVKLARDSAGARYAIKVMRAGADWQECVDTELGVLSQLQHPNIVSLVESGEGVKSHPKRGDKQVKFIVLELVAGGELFDFVALGGALNEPYARHFFGQLMEGLGFCHDQGVAHRDLKPENLLLDASFTLKISDFGFAAPIVGHAGDYMLETQCGTASHMAPEIHMGKKYEGAKVDVFAAAIVLFTIVSQRPPFRSAQASDPHYSLLAQKDYATFWDLHAQADDNGRDIYSSEFKDLFQKCLALKPNDRPSVAEIKSHPWMQGARPDVEEVIADFTQRKAIVEEESKKERENKRQERANQDRGKVKRGADGGEDDGKDDPTLAWEGLEVENYGDDFMVSQTQFFTTSAPLDYFAALVDHLDKTGAEYRISGEKLKLKLRVVLGESQVVQVTVQVLAVSQGKSCVLFSYNDAESKSAIVRTDKTVHFLSLRDVEGLKAFCDATFAEQ